jgi:hypothetical protein
LFSVFNKTKGINIFKFTAEFDSEESCSIHFKEEGDKIGVICKKRSSKAHCWIMID